MVFDNRAELDRHHWRNPLHFGDNKRTGPTLCLQIPLNNVQGDRDTCPVEKHRSVNEQHQEKHYKPMMIVEKDLKI